MPSFIRRVFSRKSLVRLLFVLAAMTTVILALIIWENWRGRRAWNAYRTAAEARGERLFLREYVAADLPDSENYAAVPVIRDLFAKRDSGQSPPNAFALPTSKSGKTPPAPDILKGKHLNLAEWQTFFVETELLPAKSDSAARDILLALEKFEPALQQLRDASTRSGCKFPTKWEDGFAVLLPHVSPLRSAGILFSLRMSALLALGDCAAAYAEFRQALRLYTALRPEPWLISGLVRVAILSRLEAAVWDGLAAGQWSEPELLALEKDFAGLHLLEDCRFAISTERGAINQELLRFATAGASGTAQLAAITQDGGGSEPSRFAARLLFGAYPSGWIFQNMLRTNEYFDVLLTPFEKSDGAAAVEVVPAGQSCEDWLNGLGARSGPKRFYYLFLNLLLPALDSVQASYLAAHTQAQQTRIGCALDRFRRARGNFPESLEALVPDYMPDVPKDVCDGNPLRYRRTADGGYDLWSIGPNRKDDGGKSEPEKSVRQQPDWLWHMPVRP
jgi:hypothetical protein